MKRKGFLNFFVLAPAFLFAAMALIPKEPVDPLSKGSRVPEFSLYDQNGKLFDIKNVLGKKNIVIYFYLKDETPGCTKESCTFRDQYSAFQQAQAMVIGISAQSVKSHREFADKNNLPFTLLSDPDNKVRKMFGVSTGEDGTLPGRVTFVIDKTGTIVYVYDSLNQPVEHVTEALKALKNIK
jgi:thioredoxin-dependent peroxiredoxin